ncbi:hypothetical protein A2U01_0108446, partial [Trifolium medium]|nr:hypothetical protein [Trifolium medium]
MMATSDSRKIKIQTARK